MDALLIPPELRARLDPDVVRVVELTRHTPFLEQCDPAHPRYHPNYVAHARRMLPELERLVDDQVDGDRRDDPPPRPRKRPLGKDALERIRSCFWRECRTGCERSRCLAGKGDPLYGDVDPWDCAACLGILEPAALNSAAPATSDRADTRERI